MDKKKNTRSRGTGSFNTGDRNAGHWNTGDRNTGDYNTGDCNTGNRNDGSFNTGDYNTGDYNIGDYNSGSCNTNTPTVRIFNKDSGWEFYSDDHNKFRDILHKYSKPLCTWVYACSMTDKEKEKNPTYETTGGFLKVNGIKRNDVVMTKEDREFLLSVPNFDNEILKECTGIDLYSEEKVKIVIDGKEIYISKESAEELKRSLID